MYEDLKSHFDQLSLLKKYEWEVFKQIVKVKLFKKGELVTEAGSVERFLSFVSIGGTRAYYIKNGNEINIDFRLEGQFVSSYASFLTQSPSYQYIEAIEDTTLYMMHYDSLQKMYSLSKNGERLGRLSAELLFIQREVHTELLLLDSPDDRFNKLWKRKKHWLQRISQKHLASYLNLTPETLSRLKKRNKG